MLDPYISYIQCICRENPQKTASFIQSCERYINPTSFGGQPYVIENMMYYF